MTIFDFDTRPRPMTISETLPSNMSPRDRLHAVAHDMDRSDSATALAAFRLVHGSDFSRAWLARLDIRLAHDVERDPLNIYSIY